MSNFAHIHLSSIRENNELLGVPDCRIPTVDVRDIGEASAALLGEADGNAYAYHKQFIECCGPTVLDNHSEIATQLSAGLGRVITYPNSPDLNKWCKMTQNPILLELYKYMADESAGGIPFYPDGSLQFSDEILRHLARGQQPTDICLLSPQNRWCTDFNMSVVYVSSLTQSATLFKAAPLAGVSFSP